MPSHPSQNATHHGGYHAHSSRPVLYGGYLPSLEWADPLPICVLDPQGRALNSPCLVDSAAPVVVRHAYLGTYPISSVGHASLVGACCASCAHGGPCAASTIHSVGGITTTADDVRNAKLVLDSQVVATDRQWDSVSLGNAQNNPLFTTAAANDYFSWSAWKNTWDAFVIDESSFLGASDDMARLNDFATELAQWQKRLAADTAATPGGALTPILPATPPSAPKPPTDPTGLEGVLTRAAIIAGVVLFGIVVIEAVPFLLNSRHARQRTS